MMEREMKKKKEIEKIVEIEYRLWYSLMTQKDFRDEQKMMYLQFIKMES